MISKESIIKAKLKVRFKCLVGNNNKNLKNKWLFGKQLKNTGENRWFLEKKQKS